MPNMGSSAASLTIRTWLMKFCGRLASVGTGRGIVANEEGPVGVCGWEDDVPDDEDDSSPDRLLLLGRLDADLVEDVFRGLVRPDAPFRALLGAGVGVSGEDGLTVVAPGRGKLAGGVW